MLALDADSNVISCSRTVHVTTKGGKNANAVKVRTDGAAARAAKKLRAGESVKLKAKAEGRRVKKHRALSYESSDPGVASVSAKGVIKEKAKGSCFVYVYAQSGIYKRVRVKVS